MASTINADNVKLMKSEVLLDTDDGGGRMTTQEILAGESNNLFPDTSTLDRVYGRLNLRKTFLSVQTDNTDSLMGANVIVAKRPEDEFIDVTLFSSENWFDQRKAAQNGIEQYVTRGVSFAGHLLETQLLGQRSIQIAMRPTDDEPRVDQCLYLVQNEGKNTEFFQYVRVSKVNSRNRTFTVDGKDVVRKVVTVETTSSLQYNFDGITVADYEKGGIPAAKVRDTQVADIARYYGSRPLAKVAKIGDRNLKVDSIYTQLVPTTQTETVVANVNAAGLKSVNVAVGAQVTSKATYYPKQATQINFGFPIVKGSVLAYRDGSENDEAEHLIDSDGDLVFKKSGLQVGRVDYDKGLVTVAKDAISANYIYVKATPAKTIQAPTHTDMIKIEQDARGYSYVRTLLPKPSAGTVTVSYETLGNVYYLYDNGRGELRASDDAFGVGQIDYASGTVTLTTGALPDADSAILFAWNSNVESFSQTVTPELWYSYPIPDGKEVGYSGVLSIPIYSGSIAVKVDGYRIVETGGMSAYFDIPRNRILLRYQGSNPPSTRQANASYTYSSMSLSFSTIQSLRNAPNALLAGTVTLGVADGAYVGSSSFKQDRYTLVGYSISGFAYPVSDDGNGNLVQNSVIVGTVDYQTAFIRLDYNKVLFNAKKRMSESAYFYANAYAKAESSIVVMAISGFDTDLDSKINVSASLADGQLSGTKTLLPAGMVVTIPKLSDYEAKPYTLSFARGSNTFSFNLNEENNSYVANGYNPFDSIVWDEVYREVLIRDNGLYYNYTANPTPITFTRASESTVSSLHFRAPANPLRQGSVQLMFKYDGKQYTVTPDEQGKMYSKDLYDGSVDYETGVFSLKFGKSVSDTTENRETYGLTADDFEDGKAWIDLSINATTLKFNAIAYRFIPLEADLLGIDPVRLPADGRVPVYRAGNVAVVHNTQSMEIAAPKAGQSYSVGRERLSSMKLYDSEGKKVSSDRFSCDLDKGVLKLAANFVSDGMTLPLLLEHRIEDSGLIADVQINGTVSLVTALSHEYPTDGTLLSSALIAGDLQARAYNVFTQRTWGNAWADSTTDVVTAKYDSANFPIQVSNKGATQERWALIFTGTNTFRLVGEHLGQIYEGKTTEDCSPVNPITGLPYFTLKAGGWGGGWTSGYVLRFNTAAANYPVWVARTVLPGASQHVSDKFCLMVRGDVDR